MRIDHALDFGGLDDRIKRCGHLGDLNNLGGKGTAKRVSGFKERAVLALKKVTKRPRTLEKPSAKARSLRKI